MNNYIHWTDVKHGSPLVSKQGDIVVPKKDIAVVQRISYPSWSFSRDEKESHVYEIPCDLYTKNGAPPRETLETMEFEGESHYNVKSKTDIPKCTCSDYQPLQAEEAQTILGLMKRNCDEVVLTTMPLYKLLVGFLEKMRAPAGDRESAFSDMA